MPAGQPRKRHLLRTTQVRRARFESMKRGDLAAAAAYRGSSGREGLSAATSVMAVPPQRCGGLERRQAEIDEPPGGEVFGQRTNVQHRLVMLEARPYSGLCRYRAGMGDEVGRHQPAITSRSSCRLESWRNRRPAAARTTWDRGPGSIVRRRNARLRRNRSWQRR
jgi:hypothetical protein